MRSSHRAAVAATLLAVAAPLVRAALGPVYGGELHVSVTSVPATLEPAAPRSAVERLHAALLHETLLTLGEGGEPRPGLAEGWGSTAGGREWRLRLRTGATFHDGSPLTAADVERSLRRFLRSRSSAASALAASLDGGPDFRAKRSDEIAGLRATEEGIALRLHAPLASPLAALASPAAAVTGRGGTAAGPFTPTLFAAGRRLAATAFTAHVRGRPYLDRVALTPRATFPATEGAMPPRGIDVVPAIGGPAIGAAASDSTAGVLLLVVDEAVPVLAAREARQALRAAIDAAALVRHFLPGGEPQLVLLPAPLLPPLADTRTPPARRRIAGRVGMAVSDEVPAALSQRIVAALGASGLEVAARKVAAEMALEARAALTLVVWVPEVPEASLALAELFAIGGHRLTIADAALSSARHELDADRRAVHLHTAEAALRAQATVIALAAVPLSYRARRGVHGVAVDPSGRLRLEDAWVEP